MTRADLADLAYRLQIEAIDTLRCGPSTRMARAKAAYSVAAASRAYEAAWHDFVITAAGNIGAAAGLLFRAREIELDAMKEETK